LKPDDAAIALGGSKKVIIKTREPASQSFEGTLDKLSFPVEGEGVNYVTHSSSLDNMHIQKTMQRCQHNTSDSTFSSGTIARQ
jgi:hypothetical protein